MSHFNHQFITLIIDRYGLELDDEHIDTTVAAWIGQYDRGWIVKAIIESLHRGRYKIKSVDSILSGWQRAGQPSYKFPPEFEREILQGLPMISDLAAVQTPPKLSQLEDLDPVIKLPRLSSEQLNPEESAPFPRHDRATPVLKPPKLEPRTELDPPFRSESLSVASFKETDDLKPNQINHHPKFQLFHTLRAIITPNNLPAADFDDLDPPSYSTNLG